MPNIIDLIAQDSKASEVSSEIKDSLYAKAAEKIEALRSGVSKVMFDEPQVENETETENELETETEKETE
tara:strand:+ start:71 stop:280 length:210 start_codon:yes stop_codon:yes gene_type:complete